MKQSKKSMIFQPLMVVVTLGILLFALSSINSKEKVLAGSNEAIGLGQINILKTYQKAEKILLYVDESAKISTKQAIYGLGQKGGYHTTSECGSYLGYNIWNTKDEKCYPNFKENIKLLVNDNLNKYLESYPDEPNQKIPKTYELSIHNNNLIGTSLENIEINITKEGPSKGLAGIYSIKPSFNINLNYNLEQYNTIIDNVKDLITLCEGKQKDEIEDCVNNYITTKNPNWKSDQRIENLFLFDVKTDKKVWVSSKLIQEDVVIKFALLFEDSSTITTGINKGIREESIDELFVGDKISFQISGEEHTLSLVSLAEYSATIMINSEPLTAVVNVGETQKIDIDKDGYYDLKITLRSIDIQKNQAVISKKTINEKVVRSNKEGDSPYINEPFPSCTYVSMNKWNLVSNPEKICMSGINGCIGIIMTSGEEVAMIHVRWQEDNNAETLIDNTIKNFKNYPNKAFLIGGYTHLSGAAVEKIKNKLKENNIDAIELDEHFMKNEVLRTLYDPTKDELHVIHSSGTGKVHNLKPIQ